MAQGFRPAGDMRLGMLAVLMGATALLVAMIHIFGGPFAPQQPVGVSIGEIAGDIRASAWRAVTGAPQPAPVPRGWDIDRVLGLAGPVIGALAVGLAAISVSRRGSTRLAAMATGLGLSAITFQFIWWLAVLMACVALLISIVEAVGDIFGPVGDLLTGIGGFFSGLFDGLFGG
ncbi:hypothetical protein [Palleronia pelagia]|uniref:Uncharacterized protein n=1 Tax=Palleronia pelagia TaxID=387096 RepID=A0A1H8KNR6_9RHOB|nr:hypothetical protein [Palleronia pelagia]SEN94599.1 hypothetical protein SAMN04488011_10866 [Palleronia pelagia]